MWLEACLTLTIRSCCYDPMFLQKRRLTSEKAIALLFSATRSAIEDWRTNFAISLMSLVFVFSMSLDFTRPVFGFVLIFVMVGQT